MQASDIKKVLSIGSGTIAQFIVTQCALFGCEVVIYAFSEDEIGAAQKAIKERVLQSIIDANMTTEAYAKETMGRMRYILTKEEIPADIDLVTESVYEDPAIKKAVWSEFAPYLPKTAVLTTNTSTMLPSLFAEASGAPERFLSWHFAANTFFRNLVDVMPHPGTDPRYTRLMADFSRRIGLNPVVIEKEVGSYLANTMLASLIVAAMKLLSGGYASATEIDRSWMGVQKVASGPFGIMDSIGLNTMLLTLKPLLNETELAPLQALVDGGHLGIKTGQGFYTYPDPAFKRPGFLTDAKPVGM
ncbi:MAG: 3-hydroxybutyryl-CoA dehydrogenase [Ruminococcaceae bacterium]|nr:3-hydroxybutyryl-CoA dehydrogenase [Oscillospiraceae bacterium]